MADGEKKNREIEKHHLIICEGKDDKGLITHFIKSFRPDGDRIVQVVDAGGKDNIPPIIKTLPNLRNFETLKTLTIIRDADDNPDGASRSVRDALRAAGFAVPTGPCRTICGDESDGGTRPIKVAYALFPKFDQMEAQGAIENLCMDILDFGHGPDLKKIKDVAEEALKKIEQSGIKYRRRHKNELHAYFSLTNEYVGKQLRHAAQETAFDFSAKALEPLRDLIQEMLKE